jgi:hypothetical protein
MREKDYNAYSFSKGKKALWPRVTMSTHEPVPASVQLRRVIGGGGAEARWRRSCDAGARGMLGRGGGEPPPNRELPACCTAAGVASCRDGGSLRGRAQRWIRPAPFIARLIVASGSLLEDKNG